MFKIKDQELSTKVTIGKARELKEKGLIDLMDTSNFTEMMLTLSNPATRLSILWVLVKDQLDGRDQDWFESQLEDVSAAFASLDADVQSFIQSLSGPGFTTRWEQALSQINQLLTKEMDLINDIMNSNEMDEQIAKVKKQALEDLKKEMD